MKENRTYDQVFGDLPKGNGDPKLSMFGRDITPNHHALAEKYVTLDNFHTGGAISFDGHQWLIRPLSATTSSAPLPPHRAVTPGTWADSLVVAPTGFFWQAATKPPSVRIYGEFCLPARWDPSHPKRVDMDEKEELSRGPNTGKPTRKANGRQRRRAQRRPRAADT